MCVWQVMGEPSIELMTSMGDDEKERVEKQRSTLGKKGLMKKADELEEATDKNEVCLREGCLGGAEVVVHIFALIFTSMSLLI